MLFIFHQVSYYFFIVVTVLILHCKEVRCKRSCLFLNPALFLCMPSALSDSIFNFADIPEEAPSGSENLDTLFNLSPLIFTYNYIYSLFVYLYLFIRVPVSRYVIHSSLVCLFVCSLVCLFVCSWTLQHLEIDVRLCHCDIFCFPIRNLVVFRICWWCYICVIIKVSTNG